MNREIKFRAWDEQWEVMYENFQFIKSGDKKNDWIVFTAENIPFTSEWKDNPFFRNQVDIMEFIGLKSKNGKDIYEGDIIRHNNKNFVCRWSELFGFCFVEINKRLGTFHLDGIVFNTHNRRSQFEISNYIKHCELIGNIYENPDLLDTKKAQLSEPKVE